MSVELRHLRYLLAVADQGSFTRAAEELHISQPTLSQQIRQLEQRLGTQLLDRTGRTVRLTGAGETYVVYARRALRDLAAAERALHEVRDLSRGHLRLAITPTFTAYLVGPLAAELHARHPGITLSVREMTQSRMESALLADDIDVGIAFAGPHQPGIEATALYHERLSLVVGADRTGPDGASGRDAPPAQERDTPPVRERDMPPVRERDVLPVRERDVLPVAEVTEHQLVLLSQDFATRGHIDAYFAEHGVTPRIAMEANSVQALTEIVRRTSLATVLPDAVTHDHPGLRPVPLDPALPPRTVTLLRRELAHLSPAAGAFSRLTREVVESRAYPPARGACPRQDPAGTRPSRSPRR
ncbi:transcriptional regulator CynR [Streptomyces sp. NPDC000410]|uniref:transcriptional regulator CynR n=1 Tax=Streptomyces sp. NPDC000410 TaxID=3154254 RepID=UPI0033347221